jgi:hypothetical protein
VLGLAHRVSRRLVPADMPQWGSLGLFLDGFLCLTWGGYPDTLAPCRAPCEWNAEGRKKGEGRMQGPIGKGLGPRSVKRGGKAGELGAESAAIICSYCQQQRFQFVLWHGQAVFPQDSDVTFNRLLDVPYRFLTPRQPAGKAVGATRYSRFVTGYPCPSIRVPRFGRSWTIWKRREARPLPPSRLFQTGAHA